VHAAEAGGRRDPAPEAEGRRLGLQAPGGGHPRLDQHLDLYTLLTTALSFPSRWTLALLCARGSDG